MPERELDVDLLNAGLFAVTVDTTSPRAETVYTRPATNDPDNIQQRAVQLLAKTDAGTRPVRLLGAGVHNLIPIAENKNAPQGADHGPTRIYVASICTEADNGYGAARPRPPKPASP